MKNKDWLVEAHKNREKAVALANRLEGVDKEYNRPKKKEKKNYST